ncbi:PTS lactose transporter subunit IIB [Paenibacillus macerans]|uniref:PTS lactose transporter subunit IIB n=1 Tax=Paenibacillus macerans TaxID=44252 RepID=A0A090ZV83_PAEMA|nr:PTS sugar transporter subunit IIB [Paenibacillus macerans]KFN08036.1 PTS system, Lactose/Cellobiose specific IIB subunit [Paenibacillus macerans]MBS5909826.1 PTS sugar transporter subunit IIB [Paenibacillus macerans]MCY7556823.1 PTS sugar transporter subunit IIB [Paenibacillus macerans]MDU5950530.1 PTS sugar transporter subunit IIB [Paenibacillus macerans]MEC0136489.1 PTS sugar transporter subunit IIB [Paenibacillus macerans]
MKILAICGTGLGSSFMLEMNVKQILSELGLSGVEVDHSDLSSATPDSADLFIAAKDIAAGMGHLGEVIVIDSIIDMDGLRAKLKDVFQAKGMI